MMSSLVMLPSGTAQLSYLQNGQYHECLSTQNSQCRTSSSRSSNHPETISRLWSNIRQGTAERTSLLSGTSQDGVDK
ncbi:hypothetical protein M404DRAFT_1007791 [Pisolithus tinctorius Marx 270]|uniref:Uncharacterized protein n=1 Tax=Pisolithus tinctorius Marx 270 TaxID=870435 RepID=A0A0C3NH81_PISTI|nr:hypothetical protein M404DRAFT_1007791 [Pisolithus tinctorius Marx 270]